MKSYLTLLKKILDEGESRDDRTGTGTLGLFGEQIRIDLADGFPLLTTKRVPFKSVVAEPSLRRLSLHLYMRSADVFLGVPFNIASYALLTHLLARDVGMAPGVLTVSFGDVHLYNNHLEQAREQLSREPKRLPRLVLSPVVRVLTDHGPAHPSTLFETYKEDVSIAEYYPHPTIKAKVSV